MASKHILIAAGIATAVLVLSFAIFNALLFQGSFIKDFGNKNLKAQQLEPPYNPQINPADFSSSLTNPFFTFISGKTFIYEGQTEEGVERIEVAVTDEKRMVMGVSAAIVRDKEFLNGELVEDTKDFFAQDKQGNVWYFGEDSTEIVDGKISSRAGSWEAGISGALPGIIMEANPQVGDSYRQEYYPGEAEDMGTVIAVGLQIKGPYGEFTDCIQIKDWTPLEPGNEEYKYYCPEVGALAYETSIEDNEGVQLIDIKTASASISAAAKEEPREEIQTDVTEQQAKEIALKRVPGRVTDIEIEKKFGKPTWVVEIDADNGPETDVIIDISTGNVLGVET